MQICRRARNIIRCATRHSYDADELCSGPTPDRNRDLVKGHRLRRATCVIVGLGRGRDSLFQRQPSRSGSNTVEGTQNLMYIQGWQIIRCRRHSKMPRLIQSGDDVARLVAVFLRVVLFCCVSRPDHFLAHVHDLSQVNNHNVTGGDRNIGSARELPQFPQRERESRTRYPSHKWPFTHACICVS